MRFFRLMAITVLLLACVVLGSACAGAKGQQGADGVGIEDVVFNADGTMTVNLTNGEEYTSANLAAGAKGDTGAQGIQGIQGVQGEPGPNMIVAMATVKGDGTILQGYNVTSVTWTSYNYQIALTGISYDYADYVTLVTSADALHAQYSSASNMLTVMILDNAGAPVTGAFSFMVLDVTP